VQVGDEAGERDHGTEDGIVLGNGVGGDGSATDQSGIGDVSRGVGGICKSGGGDTEEWDIYVCGEGDAVRGVEWVDGEEVEVMEGSPQVRQQAELGHPEVVVGIVATCRRRLFAWR
jgi:hypothetical protein